MPDFDWLTETPAESPLQENFGWIDDERRLETPDTLESALSLRRRPVRRRQLRALRQEKLEEFFTELPEPGETIHTVSNGSFDYWNFAPVTIRLLGRPVEFYGSTWTMNRANVLQLLTLYDKRLLTSATMFSGLYFKRREPAVYTALAAGLMDRGQRLLCFNNHSKIMLLGSHPDWIVIEGSANFTANPRLEQNAITNDFELFHFHKHWMEGLLANAAAKRPTEESGKRPE